MPLVAVQRGKKAGAVYITGYATQYLEAGAALSLPAANMTLQLYDAAFPLAGKYVLFDYQLGSFDGANLNAITVDDSGLTFTKYQSITNVPAEKKVILSLQSSPTNGTGYFESDSQVLTIPGSPGITLDLSGASLLYTTAGTYILFQWPTAVNYTGNLADIAITPPPGRSVATGAHVNPSFPNQIRFTLA